MKTKKITLTDREIKQLRDVISRLSDNDITLTLEQVDKKLYSSLNI